MTAEASRYPLFLKIRRRHDDQLIYVNPYNGMPVERIIEITRGRRAVVVADLSEQPSVPPACQQIGARV
ncbi:MAG: hypothetical protein N2512_12930 [Armatimonadetes bacterium]|nr:hypothetical protein [Armatimonadota bacterium]